MEMLRSVHNSESPSQIPVGKKSLMNPFPAKPFSILHKVNGIDYDRGLMKCPAHLIDEFFSGQLPAHILTLNFFGVIS